MRINKVSFTIKYSLINDLTRTIYSNLHLLEKDFFLENQISVPDNIPVDIPRFVFKSLGNHSAISVSPVALVFDIYRFDNDYDKDWDMCSVYLLNKSKIVFDFLNAIKSKDVQYEYLGIVADINYDEFNENVISILKSNLLKDDSIPLYDLYVKYTFVENEKFFMNIALQNARIFKNGIKGNSAGELSIDNQDKEVIEAIIDINDRYAFNTKKGYSSNEFILNELIECMNENIKYKIFNLIEKGKYCNGKQLNNQQ